MIELKTDIFYPSFVKTMDAICFTSNGVLKSNGDLVMGKGVAKAFADKFPYLPAFFGKRVKQSGNRVFACPSSYDGKQIVVCSFPTKHHWRDPSDLKLIEKSAHELVGITSELKWKHVALPYPGIGLGGLDKATVRTIIKPILDDRFYVLVK